MASLKSVKTGKNRMWPCFCVALFAMVMTLVGLFLNWNKALCKTESLMLSPSSVVLASEFGILGVPWCRPSNGRNIDWSREDLLKGLKEFVLIYERRPIKKNKFGMGFDHSFGLWFITKRVQPDLMIESGAFKGHSTWVLRQAMPSKPIISITPRHPEKYLQKGPAYVDSNCKYYAGKEFMDFGNIHWQSVMQEYGIKNYSKVLIFFDDHQNELKRFQQALKAGFQHLVFEDNYDTGTGDHYSLRQICDQPHIKGGGHSCNEDTVEARVRAKRRDLWEKGVDIKELCAPNGAWWGVRGHMRDNFNHSFAELTVDEHYRNSKIVESVLDLYWELPPVAAPSLTYQKRYDPARTIDPIIGGNESLFFNLGLAKLDKELFNGYTQMVYVQISQ